jgi:hypothetical protein
MDHVANLVATIANVFACVLAEEDNRLGLDSGKGEHREEAPADEVLRLPVVGRDRKPAPAPTSPMAGTDLKGVLRWLAYAKEWVEARLARLVGASGKQSAALLLPNRESKSRKRARKARMYVSS